MLLLNLCSFFPRGEEAIRGGGYILLGGWGRVGGEPSRGCYVLFFSHLYIHEEHPSEKLWSNIF